MEKQEIRMPQAPQKSSYKIIIPTKVENMIRLLCSEVRSVEWSGTLFYTYTGSFERNDLVIRCEDICVMDIGSSGYTEFTESPEIINYQIEHDLLDCKTGLIHSHNYMKTFFSGTDTNTLKEEGASMNNFVSLIVNNAGNYTAAITRLVTSVNDIRSSKSYKFFDSGEIDLGSSQYYEQVKEVQSFLLEVIKEEGENNKLLSRLDEIRNSKSNNKVKENTSPTKLLNNEKNNLDKKEIEPFNWDYTPKNHSTYIDPDIVENATLQIVTGSIAVTNKNKVTLESWIPKMESIFSKRFPNFKEYNYWVNSNIDLVLDTTYIDNSFKTFDDDISTLALEILQKLDTYSNKYIDVIKETLKLYL